MIDGTVLISNTGTINQDAAITIGGGGGQVAGIANGKGAHFNVSGAFTIGNGAATGSRFNNAGTVSVGAGTGTATFATTFNNLAGGVINVSSGALQNTGILNNSGTISGAKLVLGGGQTTFNTGSVLSVGEIDLLNAASLTLGATLTYAGHFVDASDGNNQLNLGATTLSLTGQTDFDPSFGDDVIAGTGVLKLQHASTLEGTTVELAGGAHLDIDNKLIASGNLQVGDGTANAAAAAIGATGTYDLIADAGVGVGASAASTLTNAGLFEKTAGSGVSVVSVDFVNNGTITVTSGTLEFLKGTLSGSGTINGVKTTDSNGDTLITAAAPSGAPARVSASKAQAAGASEETPPHPAGRAHLLAQAVAMFGVDRSFGTRSAYGSLDHLGASLGLVATSPVNVRHSY